MSEATADTNSNSTSSLSTIDNPIDRSKKTTQQSHRTSESKPKKESAGKEHPAPFGTDISNGKTRTRTERTTKRETKQGRKPSVRWKAKLSNLPELPLDVLYTIFGFLTPKDLMSITRASKDLRSVLMTRKAIGVWKEARRRFPGGVPDYPPDFSEPRWANLLFGASTCENCGRNQVRRIDFGLCRRVCNTCLVTQVVGKNSLARIYPQCDASVVEYIPYSDLVPVVLGLNDSNQLKYYWRRDVEKMDQKLKDFNADIRDCKPGARESFENFKAARMAQVKAAAEFADRCKKWLADQGRRRAQELEARRLARNEAIYARFRDLGYEDCEISVISGMPAFNHPTELTDIIWRRIRPKLEVHIKAAHDRRGEIVSSRRSLIEVRYNRLKNTKYFPSEWAAYPRLEEILQTPGFIDLINKSLAHSLTPEDCDHALDGIHDLLNARIKTVGGILLQKMLGDDATEHTELVLYPLTLATSVFCCSNEGCEGTVMWTLNEVLAHVCKDTSGEALSTMSAQDIARNNVMFSQRGASAVKELIEELKKSGEIVDASVTVPESLDGLDKRFFCLCCPVRPMRSGFKGRLACSWKQCAAHFIASDVESHPTPEWMVLDVGNRTKVRNLEAAPPGHLQRVWSCDHCNEHFEDYKTFGEVALHVRNIHDIFQPAENIDIVHVKSVDLELENAVEIPVGPQSQTRVTSPPREYQCLQCTSRAAKIYCSEGVNQHIRSKHHVAEPIQDEHFLKICPRGM